MSALVLLNMNECRAWILNLARTCFLSNIDILHVTSPVINLAEQKKEIERRTDGWSILQDIHFIVLGWIFNKPFAVDFHAERGECEIIHKLCCCAFFWLSLCGSQLGVVWMRYARRLLCTVELRATQEKFIFRCSTVCLPFHCWFNISTSFFVSLACALLTPRKKQFSSTVNIVKFTDKATSFWCDFWWKFLGSFERWIYQFI